MTIPSKIKIGGHLFTINIVDMKGRDLMGECDYSKNTISIDKDLVQSQKEATLFHEMLHAMNATWDSNEDGHRFLESISQQLYQVFVDNNMLR